MQSKMGQILTFMTVTDERNFSLRLKERFPKITFVDSPIWDTLPPPTKPTIADCASTMVVVLNEEFVSFAEYCSRMVVRHPSGQGYMGAQVGSGLIQCLRPGVVQNGTYLKDGRLAFSYPKSDAEMAEFVKGVWGILRKGGRKVYQTYPATGTTNDKPVAGLIAWPDAAARFNGDDGRYLIQAAETFLVAR
ncbi:MAG TPA: hypothetical protein VGB66_02450 [Longimicrobium sp.]|jgi:hypothetical protein